WFWCSMSVFLVSILPPAVMLNSCCQRHSIGSLPARAIRSYVVQNATDICRINAVIFYTHRGKMFCADPNQKWVQLYLTVLKKLEKMDHDNAQNVHEAKITKSSNLCDHET
uniref:C-C motif chemokine n=1 Tax=Salarias fasciatus TaxID=181472 RepID=A0A672H3W0_SALFA